MSGASLTNDPVHIYLPVRDGGAHLSAAIDSIRAQGDSHWRLTVLDNRSTDDSRDRVTALNDPRITLLEAAAPLSITDSWARIRPLTAELPHHSLVTLIGHDDLFKPGFISTVRQLARDDPDATLLQTQFELIDERGALIRPARPVPAVETASDLLAALCWGIRDSFGTGYCFRAGDYAALGGVPPLPRLLYADHLLFARLTALGRKRCSASVECSYRLHPGSASNGVSPDRLTDHALALDLFVEVIADEFDEFARTDLGRNALLTLFSRELLILKAPGVTRALSPTAREAVGRLQARQLDLGVRRTMARAHSPLERARRWSVALRLLRHQLGARV